MEPTIMKRITLILSLIIISTSLSFAQSRKEKKRQKKEKATKEFVETKKLIDSGQLKFQFDWADTQKGRRVSLTGNTYTLSIDTVSMTGAADLPYFGVVQVGGYGADGGIKFSGSISDYSVKYKEKKRQAFVRFKTKGDGTESFNFNVSITGAGSARATVTSSYRNSISYSGNLVAP